ncbi:signal-transducing adaptor protein 2 isoform X1 [Pelobates fuscus]|uniref:signal-transducing adaptor protein 2 isoform X1 n=1 Tax=Pelobates fuscus TaxID=191477 RepID=UPI002FE485B0
MSRIKNATPEHYFEEYLYKKDVNDKVYKKTWVGLLGNCLCFYSNHKDLRRVDSLSLENFICFKEPTTLPSEYLFSLCMTGREVQFKTDSLESREMWRAYIITVAELNIPQSVTLLPGPLLSLREALEKEKLRRSQEDVEEMPSCFHNVSRSEAETLLKQFPECGSLLLRPGGSPQTVSVTTCQRNVGTFVLKHYRVTQEQNKYVIQVEPPVTCPTLAQVVNHFKKTTKNLLIPFEKANEYENKIGVLEVDGEDGVATVRYPTETSGTTRISNKCNVPPPLPREPIPQETYENPNDGYTAQEMIRQAPEMTTRRVHIPLQPVNKYKGPEGTRHGAPSLNSGFITRVKRCVVPNQRKSLSLQGEPL